MVNFRTGKAMKRNHISKKQTKQKQFKEKNGEGERRKEGRKRKIVAYEFILYPMTSMALET